MIKRTVVTLPLLATLLFAPVASADDKTACIDAASKGQNLRDAHQLVEAREQFRACAAASCPSVVQGDCATWFGDVDKIIPTVVLSAKDAAGHDLLDVTVTVDGKPLAAQLTGEAVPVDPGLHAFHFERAGAVATQQVLVKEGQKAQSVGVVLVATATPVATPVAPSPAAPAPASDHPPARGLGTQRLLALVVGGAGVLALGAGGILGLDAKSKDTTAAGETGPARQSDSQSAVSEGNVATVVFVAGGVMAAAGVVLWLTAPHAPAATAVGTNGRELFLRGTF